MAQIHTEDTIIAPATIAGTGAIALIRISGPRAVEVGASLVRLRRGTLSEGPAGRVHFGVIYDGDAVLDEVLCYAFRSPHSYTGEDSVEITCHSSAYIVSRVIELALGLGLGCRMAEPGEFTCRAYLNGKMDLTQAEAVADLISCGSEASHRVAMSQLRGGFSAELRELRGRLLEMTALMELELDFSEEEVEFADRGKLFSLLELILGKVGSLISSFKLGNAIKNGVPVAIVGAANSGKSTLLNAILGEDRAIVSDIAGTTRDTVEERFNAGGVLFRFVDTAGIRFQVSDAVEEMGISRSLRSLTMAEFVLLVVDVTAVIDERLLGEIVGRIDFGEQKLLVVVNKSDLVGCDVADGVVSDLISVVNNFVNRNNRDVSYIGTENVSIISAGTGFGVDVLVDKLASMVKNQRMPVSGNADSWKNGSLGSDAGTVHNGTLGSDSVLVTNLRHYQALIDARTSLLSVRSGLESGVPTDLVAEDLRTALTTLGSITGEISSDEVLGEIFGKFCIGK